MKQPLQARSAASLERLLSATERLVRERGFERTSLSMICTEAGLTSGAFYARFDRKEDLAMALWERMEPGTGGAVDQFEEILKNGSLEQAVHALMLEVIGIYERDGVLIREFVSVARQHSDLARAMRLSNERVLQNLIDVIRRSKARITHPAPDLALRLGLVCVFNTLRELVLDRTIFEHSGSLQPEVLATEMKRLLMSYLRS